MKDPVAMTPLQIRDALEKVAALMREPHELVGQHVPDAARIWAEDHNVQVRETQFCPPNRLFIVGAVPVPDVFVP